MDCVLTNIDVAMSPTDKLDELDPGLSFDPDKSRSSHQRVQRPFLPTSSSQTQPFHSLDGSLIMQPHHPPLENPSISIAATATAAPGQMSPSAVQAKKAPERVVKETGNGDVGRAKENEMEKASKFEGKVYVDLTSSDVEEKDITIKTRLARGETFWTSEEEGSHGLAAQASINNNDIHQVYARRLRSSYLPH